MKLVFVIINCVVFSVVISYSQSQILPSEFGELMIDKSRMKQVTRKMGQPDSVSSWKSNYEGIETKSKTLFYTNDDAVIVLSKRKFRLFFKVRKLLLAAEPKSSSSLHEFIESNKVIDSVKLKYDVTQDVYFNSLGEICDPLVDDCHHILGFKLNYNYSFRFTEKGELIEIEIH